MDITSNLFGSNRLQMNTSFSLHFQLSSSKSELPQLLHTTLQHLDFRDCEIQACSVWSEGRLFHCCAPKQQQQVICFTLFFLFISSLNLALAGGDFT